VSIKEKVMRTIYAFTDVHGHYDIARSAFEYILAMDADARFIGLGDYVDRGPRSPELVEYLIENEIECLMGNHESMMIGAHDVGYYSGAGAYRFWAGNGGLETEKSYEGQEDLRAKHVLWMRGLPTFIETEANIFVHAGLNPDKTMAEQTNEDRMWIRNKFLFSLHDFGKHVVHGHTPREGIELRPNRTNLDVGTPFVRRMAIGAFKEDVKGPVGIILLEAKDEDSEFTVSRYTRTDNVWSDGIKETIPNNYKA
jgi:serine/threonine protein phosphatase 1